MPHRIVGRGARLGRLNRSVFVIKSVEKTENHIEHMTSHVGLISFPF